MSDSQPNPRIPRTGVSPRVGVAPSAPRPGRSRGKRDHAAAGTRKVTLWVSIAAAFGLTVAIGTETVTTNAGASAPPGTDAPSTAEQPTTTTFVRRWPTTPTTAPQRRVTTTTTDPYGNYEPPRTQTRGS